MNIISNERNIVDLVSMKSFTKFQMPSNVEYSVTVECADRVTVNDVSCMRIFKNRSWMNIDNDKRGRADKAVPSQ